MSDKDTTRQEREGTDSSRAGGSVAGTMPGGTTSGTPGGQGGTNTGQTDTLSGDLRVGTTNGDPTPITESTGMGGAGRQPIAPATAGKESASSGGTPRAGTAGAREDAEAGGTAAEKSGQADQDAASKAAEYITSTILGDREPGEVEPLHPAGSTRENDRKRESEERLPATAADEHES